MHIWTAAFGSFAIHDAWGLRKGRWCVRRRAWRAVSWRTKLSDASVALSSDRDASPHCSASSDRICQQIARAAASMHARPSAL